MIGKIQATTFIDEECDNAIDACTVKLHLGQDDFVQLLFGADFLSDGNGRATLVNDRESHVVFGWRIPFSAYLLIPPLGGGVALDQVDPLTLLMDSLEHAHGLDVVFIEGESLTEFLLRLVEFS